MLHTIPDLLFVLVFVLQFDYAFVNTPAAVGKQFVRNVVINFSMVRSDRSDQIIITFHILYSTLDVYLEEGKRKKSENVILFCVCQFQLQN